MAFCIVPAESQAEIYRWKDATGKVHYGDKKPEGFSAESVDVDAKQAKVNKPSSAPAASSSAAAASPASLPAGLKRAVILYVTPDCGYCKQTRQFFAFNNIHYVEYDITTDLSASERFYRLGGTEAPVILVGDTVIYGYNVPALVDALGITLE